MNRLLWAALPVAAVVAGCVTPTGTEPPLTTRLADTQMLLTGAPGADPAAGPMRMTLRRDGTGVMTYAGLELTYKWATRGANDLCLTDLRLSGTPSDDTRPQCSRMEIDGDRVTMTGIGPEQRGRKMTGTIRPL